MSYELNVKIERANETDKHWREIREMAITDRRLH